ncbi:hypothetical protein [Mesorhizobium sp. ES1-1]|uniref:hypothetical protein n=1 Tax=Mesorhizobium sp. ES1-1 TaxID=2876629 RepID=UPI001CCFCBCC|nr:hypothetical protein [Mesorhizobium sp. ES1-1]MBZ9677200.1 hypothetical protein [Mesorhizobium sp. ES1-1]
MAETTKSDVPQSEDAQKTMERQIAELRREITKINKTIAARSADLVNNASEQASDMYDTAAARASRTTQQLRTQAQAVSDVARENPGTTTALVGVICLLGFLAGLAVGQTTSDTTRRWY